ncbi:MAG: outer membrane beta-barrel protein [Bacteroidota bacterium]
MGQLDDFFKRKMEARGPFELKEDYWKEMEAMLDKKKRKRRAVWWWWGSGVVVVVGLGGVGWGGEGLRGLGVEGFGGLGVWGTEEGGRVEDGVVLGDEFGVLDDEVLVVDMDSLVDSGGRMDEGRVVDAEVGELSVQGLRDGFGNTDVVERSVRGLVPDMGSLEKDPSNQLAVDVEELDLQRAATIGQEIEDDLPALLGDGIIEEEGELESREGISPLDLVPTLELLPLFDDNSEDSLLLAIELGAQESKWQVALEGGSAWYPYFNGSEKAIGATAGVQVSYAWNDRWRVLTGLSYRYRTGDFDFAKAATISNFRFGREDQRFFLLPESLHYLELPMGGQWTKGLHQLEMGIRWSYLLGVRGSLESTFGEEGNPFGNTQQEDSGWIEEDGFVQWHLDALVGYGFRLNRRWSVWTRVNYTIPGLLDGNYPSPFGLQLEESEPVFIDVGLRVYLK